METAAATDPQDAVAVGPHAGGQRDAEWWGGDRWIRPLRVSALRDLLDAEFRRNHRFERLSSFFGDLRSMLRKAVVRDEETLPLERFLPSSPPREF